MTKQFCKHCGKAFLYCRACVFKPVWYHDRGFCSAECFTAYTEAHKE